MVSPKLFIVIWLISLFILIWFGFVYIYKNKVVSDVSDIDIINHKKEKKLVLLSVISIFGIFLSIYSYLILYGQDFGGFDYNQFTLNSLRGKFYPMPIWPSLGRFWPLGLQEYNLISIFSKTPSAYHLFSIVQLFIIISVIYWILPNFNSVYKFLIIVFIMTKSSFVTSFFGLIYPERNLIFWLAIFIICIQQLTTDKTRSFLYFCGALVSTQFLLYYKEPMFLFIGGFAVSQLIIKFKFFTNKFDSGWRGGKHLIRSNYLNFSLIALSSVFIILFLVSTIGRVESSYGNATSSSLQKVFSTFLYYLYVRVDVLLLIFLVTFLLRIIYLFLSRKKPDLIWDSLGFGGILYFIGFIILGLKNDYYMAPIHFIATLYLITMIYKGNIIKNKNKSLILFSLMTLLFLQNFSNSSIAILNQKKYIEANVQITKFLKNYVDLHKNNDFINLFIPNIDGYNLMDFSAFMDYKGLNIFSDKDNNSNFKNPSLVINSNKQYLDNLCVLDRDVNCYYNKEENSDLIIFLPLKNFMPLKNDLEIQLKKAQEKLELKQYEQKLMEVKANKNKYILLFHYQPSFNNVEKILFFFTKGNFPDKAYNSYVFKKI